MKHAVVVAHPNQGSLTVSCARAYAEAAEALGDEVVVRDLYRLGFDPCLKPGEVPGPGGYRPEPEVSRERALLADVDVFALVYPLWFNAPPAMLKGYVDRVFSLDFGYVASPGGTAPNLVGRKLISFTFSGAPDRWVRDSGALSALMTLFDRHISAMCGLELVDHVHTGDIVSNITEEAVEEILQSVGERVRSAFGAQSVRRPSSTSAARAATT